MGLKFGLAAVGSPNISQTHPINSPTLCCFVFPDFSIYSLLGAQLSNLDFSNVQNLSVLLQINMYLDRDLDRAGCALELAAIVLFRGQSHDAELSVAPNDLGNIFYGSSVHDVCEWLNKRKIINDVSIQVERGFTSRLKKPSSRCNK